MMLAVGIDGGSTKTIALCCDETGRALGVGRGGASNWEVVGLERAAETISTTIAHALHEARASLSDLSRIHMGLSGQDWPGDVPRMLDALRPHLGAIPQALENDSFLGIRANCRSGTGITVSAGSGVCCSIIPVREPPFFYGYFGELGGGIDIDSRMLHAVIRAEDGRGPRTALTEPMLRATGHQSVADMLNAMSREGYHPSHLALRPVLFAVALDGDSAAVAIVTGFGRELALLATNLVRRYALEREAVAVVASGSLFVRTGGLLFATFRDEVHAVAPAADVILAAHEPVVGAARAALAARGVAEPAVWQNLCETYAKLQS